VEVINGTNVTRLVYRINNLPTSQEDAAIVRNGGTPVRNGRQLFDLNNLSTLVKGVQTINSLLNGGGDRQGATAAQPGGGGGGSASTGTSSLLSGAISGLAQPFLDRLAEQAIYQVGQQVLGPQVANAIAPYAHNFLPRPSEVKDFVEDSPGKFSSFHYFTIIKSLNTAQ
jgi:hypothetical protein